MYAGDVNYDIAAHISPATSLVVLTDAQGNQAVVTSSGQKFGNIMFYDISAVLMSGVSAQKHVLLGRLLLGRLLCENRIHMRGRVALPPQLTCTNKLAHMHILLFGSMGLLLALKIL